MLYGLRGKIAYILHGHKGIVTSLSAQKGIYRSILSLIGLGFNLLYQMVLYLTCNFGPQGRPFICAPKVPIFKSSECKNIKWAYSNICNFRQHFFKVLVQIPYSQANRSPILCNFLKGQHFMPKTAFHA